MGEDWANDLVDALCFSLNPNLFAITPYHPRRDTVSFTPDMITWGTKTISPGMVISATDHAAPSLSDVLRIYPNPRFVEIMHSTDKPSAVVTLINRHGATDALCTCGTLFERCTYPNCNAREYANRERNKK